MFWNKALLSVTALTLAACGGESGVMRPDDQLAGFGTAVATNQAVQVGYAVAGPSFEVLSARFAAEVDDTVNFEFNRSDLTPQARATLDQQAAWLRRNPQARLRVEGHTDLVGGENYNLQLGLRRAESAVNYLVTQGIRRERLDAIATFGERQPIVNTTRREVLNRRAVTRVAGVAINYPGDGFDGKRAQAIYDGYVDRPVWTLQSGDATTSGGGGNGE